eukprot:scaffold154332_cov17-Tisochrysis_lutea.AAC.1
MRYPVERPHVRPVIAAHVALNSDLKHSPLRAAVAAFLGLVLALAPCAIEFPDLFCSRPAL